MFNNKSKISLMIKFKANFEQNGMNYTGNSILIRDHSNNKSIEIIF